MNDNTTNAQDVKGIPPFVAEYIRKGWEVPIPLPQGAKYPPGAGMTGRIARLTQDEIRAHWEGVSGSSNCGLRMQIAGEYDVVGLDVDQYDKKHGKDNLVELMETLGDLPLHEIPRSTRRGVDADSAQFFFLVPKGLDFRDKVCADVDVVQFGHRYSAVWPSEVEGQTYRWYIGDEEVEIPNVKDLPVLDEVWVDYLKRDSLRYADAPAAPSRGYEDALNWLEGRVYPGESDYVPQIDWEDVGGRHDAMRSEMWSLLCGAVFEGRAGLLSDLETLRSAFLDATNGAPERVSAYERALINGVAKIEGAITSGMRPDRNWLEMKGIPNFGDLLARQAEAYLAEMIEEEQTSESLEDRRAAAVAAVEASAPEDYWQTQPVLAEIAHYATRASVDKYSLLFRVLTYLSAEMPPTVYLEDMGQPLTLYSAVIAESGAGKGVLDKVADALVGQYLYNGDPVLRPGTGNLHTLLTALGDFTRPETKKNEDGTEEPLPMKKHRMLIQGNELAAWAEMQGNAEWAGAMADVFDGQGDYEVRNTANCYHFGVNQHSLAVTFSVQPDAAGYLFAATGRGLPGRFLISALPPLERVLPEDFDPWDLDSDFEVDTFDPARDVSRLKINSRFFLETGPFHLSDDARRVNARLKRAWDEELGEYKQLRAEKIFSQMPKVKLRVAVLLTVLLDLGEGREVPLEALRMADFLLKVSVENTRYARDLADAEARKGNAAVAAERKRADADADLTVAKENVLAVIDKSPNGKAGLGRINDRKRATAEHHPAAIAELVAEGVLEVIKTPKAPDAYKRV
ncbi:MAG: DUF3987 domain-containing protein [Corynebacterium humireducens]|jgi:hypothetical protein|uniref:DUF3987 domain-containing protein n=1 Tax=Corynebacterium humireducens TaxID=1223514 RepID=A0A7X6PNF2_9CORY|nr:DUF3987 domain-containing protein [Corynebacterium humireducens]